MLVLSEQMLGLALGGAIIASSLHQCITELVNKISPSTTTNVMDWNDTPRRTPSLPNLASYRMQHVPVTPREGRRRAPFSSGLQPPFNPTTPSPQVTHATALRTTTPVQTPVEVEQPMSYMCDTCGSNSIRHVSNNSRPPDRGADSTHSLEVIFRIIRKQKWGLGGFLEKVFTHHKEATTSPTITRSVTNFLHNNSKEGARPTDILDLIYNHPKSFNWSSSGGKPLPTAYSSLPEYAVSPDDLCDSEALPELSWPPSLPPRSSAAPLATTAESHGAEHDGATSAGPTAASTAHAHATIDQWCLQTVIANVDREAGQLAEQKFGYAVKDRTASWASLLLFNMQRIRQTIMHVAPTTWVLLMTICTSPWRRDRIAQKKAAMQSGCDGDLGDDALDDEDPSEALGSDQGPSSSKRTRTPRSPWLVSFPLFWILLVLISFKDCHRIVSDAR